MERTRVADRVRAVRGLRFVGRHTERELFRQAVEAQGEPPFTVLHVHGPGGIGKSALLRVFGDLAAAAGAGVAGDDLVILPQPGDVGDAAQVEHHGGPQLLAEQGPVEHGGQRRPLAPAGDIAPPKVAHHGQLEVPSEQP
ncbi:MAG: ATP-binding protein, partial [Pseudonocardia sp.]|nr:ATP-binding protein [Pseudonocardia sp.]